MITNALANVALWTRMQSIRWTHWRNFEAATTHPAETQAATLKRILTRQARTRFGHTHGFDTISTPEEFTRRVPLHTYESLRPHIEAQEQTGDPVLNTERPIMYARTSGTTGQPKLIPIVRETLRELKRGQAIQAYAQFRTDPAAYYGLFLAVVSPAREGTLESGTPYGSTSGFMYAAMPRAARLKYVVPPEVFSIADYDVKYLLILRLAIAHDDLTHIACANPSTLLRLATLLDTHRDELLADVSAETWSRLADVPAQVRTAVAARLSCSPHRVDELRRVLGRSQPTFADVWPHVRLVSTWTGGSCRIPLAVVRPSLPGHTRISELGYLSSELRGTLVVDIERGLGAPTLLDTFFEFVERDDWDAGNQRFHTLEELETGREYYIFPTTSNGLYRYDMNDIVRVTGRFHETPTLAFVQKGKGVTSITGEKLYESQVVEAVRIAEEAVGTSSGFFLMIADAERNQYILVIECASAGSDWDHTMRDAVEHCLIDLNLEYAAKRSSGRLHALDLWRVTAGTDEAYKRHCIEQGQREGQFKLVALQYRADCDFPFAQRRMVSKPDASL